MASMIEFYALEYDFRKKAIWHKKKKYTISFPKLRIV